MKTLIATPEPPPRNERPWMNTATSTATTGGWIVLDRRR